MSPQGRLSFLYELNDSLMEAAPMKMIGKALPGTAERPMLRMQTLVAKSCS
jgi:hypothetical protein